MEINSSLASKLYQNVQGAVQPGESDGARKGAGESAFSAVKNFVETLHQAEKTSEAGMLGKADPQSVVTALASAEIAVQSAVSIRDRVVQSYQEILRMPV